MSAARGYTPARHMSRTLLASVNENTGGGVKVSGVRVFEAAAPGRYARRTRTDAPTLVFDETKSAAFPRMARGTTTRAQAATRGDRARERNRNRRESTGPDPSLVEPSSSGGGGGFGRSLLPYCP